MMEMEQQQHTSAAAPPRSQQQQQSAVASIFKRGQKADTVAEAAAEEQDGGSGKLDQYLDGLAQAWSNPKTRRGAALAVWRPQVGAFEVVSRGRQLFAGQGFMHAKKLYLNVEEAVFLLDRAISLLAIEGSSSSSNSGGHHQQHQHKQAPLPVEQHLLSMQEALHMMALLQVPADRLVVLGHLCRLGFTVRRHPACWLVPPEQQPQHSWQVTPAWSGTDGLPALTADEAAAARTAAAAAAAYTHHHPQQQQPQQQEGDVKQPPEHKRRKLTAAGAGGPAREEQQPAAAADGPPARSWYASQPAWLQPTPPAAAAAAAAPQQQQQQQLVATVEAELPGVELQRRFPLLQPLARYRDDAAAAAGGGGAGGSAASSSAPTPTADLLYDVLMTVGSSFSYRAPPRPHFSVAMARPGCSSLPPLDELLDLSAAAAGAGAGTGAASAAAATATPGLNGDQQQQQSKDEEAASHSCCYSYAPVKFALPEEGDVTFCELKPVRLMSLLTNQC